MGYERNDEYSNNAENKKKKHYTTWTKIKSLQNITDLLDEHNEVYVSITERPPIKISFVEVD